MCWEHLQFDFCSALQKLHHQHSALSHWRGSFGSNSTRCIQTLQSSCFVRQIKSMLDEGQECQKQLWDFYVMRVTFITKNIFLDKIIHELPQNDIKRFKIYSEKQLNWNNQFCVLIHWNFQPKSRFYCPHGNFIDKYFPVLMKYSFKKDRIRRI